MTTKKNTAAIWFKKLKPLWFILLSLPFCWMLYQVVLAPEQLGADPAKSLVDQSGLWAIRAILLALAITPLRIVTKQTGWIHWRRMTGLFAFFYATVHFLAYFIFLIQADLGRIYNEILHRPYIVVGFIALILYIPLAITSTHAWQKRLKRNWGRLHKLVYIIGVLAVIHMTWLKKVGLMDTWPYVLILVVLLAIRWIPKLKTYFKK